jgi:hypothetical protein
LCSSVITKKGACWNKFTVDMGGGGGSVRKRRQDRRTDSRGAKTPGTKFQTFPILYLGYKRCRRTSSAAFKDLIMQPSHANQSQHLDFSKMSLMSYNLFEIQFTHTVVKFWQPPICFQTRFIRLHTSNNFSFYIKKMFLITILSYQFLNTKFGLISVLYCMCLIYTSMRGLLDEKTWGGKSRDVVPFNFILNGYCIKYWVNALLKARYSLVWWIN